MFISFPLQNVYIKSMHRSAAKISHGITTDCSKNDLNHHVFAFWYGYIGGSFCCGPFYQIQFVRRIYGILWNTEFLHIYDGLCILAF